MTRYSGEHKERTRRAILSAAAPTLRAKGITGAGVGEIMGRAGLTHGGFYAHFSSKEELVAESCVADVSEAGERLLAVAERTPPDERIRALLDAYLTEERRDRAGCTIATLGCEIARQPAAVRDAFTRACRESLHRIAATMPDADAVAVRDPAAATEAPGGPSPAGAATGAADSGARRNPASVAETSLDQALALMSGMVGAMMLARAVSDPELSDRFLDVGRRAVTGAVERVRSRPGR